MKSTGLVARLTIYVLIYTKNLSYTYITLSGTLGLLAWLIHFSSEPSKFSCTTVCDRFLRASNFDCSKASMILVLFFTMVKRVVFSILKLLAILVFVVVFS